MTPTQCPKCQGSMTRGFIFDRDRHTHGLPAKWVEGAPEPSLWFGVKTGGRVVFQVIAYRCERCGFLEHYAENP